MESYSKHQLCPINVGIYNKINAVFGNTTKSEGLYFFSTTLKIFLLYFKSKTPFLDYIWRVCNPAIIARFAASLSRKWDFPHPITSSPGFEDNIAAIKLDIVADGVKIPAYFSNIVAIFY